MDLASYLSPPELAKLFEIEKPSSIVQKTVKPVKDIPEADVQDLEEEKKCSSEEH